MKTAGDGWAHWRRRGGREAPRPDVGHGQSYGQTKDEQYLQHNSLSIDNASQE